MDPLRVIEELDGFFTTAQLHDLGYEHKAIAAQVRHEVWRRVRRGYFVFADTWAGLDEVERHRVRSHMVLHSLGPVVALSHVSGVIEHGIATWAMDLTRVHVTRLDGGAGRIEGDVVHHEGMCLDEDLRVHDGHRVLAPERCVLEAASRAEGAAKLVPLDSLLYLGLGTHESLAAQFALMERWPYVRSMQVPVRMADGGAQTPGETRGRHLFWSARLPCPVTQFEVRDADGTLVGTCDWGWPAHGLLGEFDGRVKYGRLLKPGQEPGDVVFAEKQREDRLREVTGFRVVRIIWSDYDRPRLTVRRIQRLLRSVG
ncbi:MAG: type IV toxin-antitoxin system AbiEi family antitoxin domain-containing protein [Nocardioides sp.]|nr:type IV toxin-antitoxin system AbiEi family antitoxin domain-containing protein [Nocardioides sp.]